MIDSETISESSDSPSTQTRSESQVPGLRKLDNRRPAILTLIIVISGACFLYYALLTPDRFGAYHDDGIYVTTAKALAEGAGYRIISLPYEPSQTKYPPFYPFLLSLIWSAYPEFPQNLTTMTLLSVIATLGFLAIAGQYLVKYNYATVWQAVFAVGLTALNWRTMILATSVYSEMLFALLGVAALYLAEKHERSERALLIGVLAGVLIGLAFLTRSSGIALLLSVPVYHVIRRQWKRAVLPVTVASLFVIGWIVWCSVNRTDAQSVNVPYYTSYIGHLNQVITDTQAQSGSSKLTILLNMAVANFVGGVLISVPLVSTGLSYNSFAGLSGLPLAAALCGAFLILILIAVGFGRAMARRIRLLHIYIVMSLGLYLFWLPNVSYDRFLMPMLPFFLLFLVSEIGFLLSLARKGMQSADTVRRISAGFIALVSILVVAMIGYGYASGVYSSVVSLRASAARAADDAQAISWIIGNTNPSDTLVCYRDPKYFLYTGHKAVRSFPMTEGFSWGDDQASMDKLVEAVFQIFEESAARYVVVTPTDFELEDQPEQRRKTFDRLIEQNPRKLALVFQATDGRSRIYRIDETAK